ncbi:RNA 2',3'-cyclic phosphodiesterase [Paenibacillus filicis]|uniref:RNA 2',3'-cyclic phosphodiesterase n=2 Tax=Paenibacillus filicis TaxID=669464 RepID=A0ABU9DH28_9BACL
MELFVGLDFPPEVIHELERVQRMLRLLDPSAHYEPADNYHLTLRYIGEASDDESIVQRLERIRGERFRLTLQELGIFENADWNVVWVNVREEPCLLALKDKIDRMLTDAGDRIELYPFNPHISLAYYGRPGISDEFSTCPVAPLPFEVSSFHLYAVDHSPDGPRFRKVRAFKLT